ncbi:MAG TPA: hypothetical protein VF732_01630, partial [Nitrospira sp.]
MEKVPPDKWADLSRQAEAQLTLLITRSLPDLDPKDVERLVHELRLHQIELELHCEEMQRGQAEAEVSRNRYRELYESMPIGYVTLNLAGRIFDLNPAG